MALVKAPFTWPNSVDSGRSAGSEPLFTGTNRRSGRGELVWTALAISSLPVPVFAGDQAGGAAAGHLPRQVEQASPVSRNDHTIVGSRCVELRIIVPVGNN